ncbi:Similar to SLC10A3: P3 protein (Homo sapiens) [Cotesia congregata]|uniref:Similar to SLC10A3: P3 protein (Homo sapiens) n=1 Tax=Cotesia congregata TaxID=51543 RepID=A0A8J2HRK9_COTCN|nr:Similar to SLC10A3: P3 protein (Homo sapiens) [Cotesia congregata]
MKSRLLPSGAKWANHCCKNFLRVKSQNMLLIVGILLLGLIIPTGQAWQLNLIANSIKLHLDDVIQVPFELVIPTNVNSTSLEFVVENTDPTVASVANPWVKPEFLPVDGEHYNGTLNVTGVFLGKTKILLKVIDRGIVHELEKLELIVIRPERVIDRLFTGSVIALVCILYINFGCAMDWEVCRETIKRPIGPIIGSICQFILMPLLAFGIGHVLFPNKPEMQLGVFFTGISPSGGASNIWTLLLGGNLPLSISMTTVSTLASFGTMPLWIFTLGKYIFDRGNIKIPYSRVATSAIGLVVPLAIGFIIQRKCPKVCKLMVRIMKPFSVVLILFIVIFAIVTNLYLFQLFSWQIILAGMGLPWLGFLCGLIMMLVFRQPQSDVRAIAIETGIQNTGIAIFLLKSGIEQPTADLTTVIPVSCAIMTPIPLIILWLIKIIYDRRKDRHEKSSNKLQPDGMPIVISNLSAIQSA